MACVVPDHTQPHNHPMPPMTKASYEIKKVYQDCIKAAGVLGATVRKVDDGTWVQIDPRLSHTDVCKAVSTKILLEGQSPALFNPSLHAKRLKQDLIRSEKLKSSPEGLGLEGKCKSGLLNDVRTRVQY